MMHMEQRLVQTQTQRLMLTQKMQQAIQILQYSGLELEHHIQQELDANPTLEELQKEPESTPESSPETPDATEKDPNDDSSFDLDEYASQWSDPPRTGQDLSRNTDGFKRRDYFESTITKEESFVSRILTQLRLAAKDDGTYPIGERIVGDIDDKGYFTGSCEEIAQELDVPVERVQQALGLIQSFEPTGIGARDVVECLLLQIEVEFPWEEQLKTLVRDHLEELEHRQIPKIAKTMHITPERVEELKTMLSTLNPWPGLEYSGEPPQYVTPDVIVEKTEDGKLDVYLSSESSPELRVSREYRDLMRRSDTTAETKQYLRGKVESARWLIRNIQQRQDTILRIATAIVEVQQDFFEKGIEAIRPLTLQEIADKVSVHEATVSRTTRGKYMQTPQGLFEMKFFFSPGLRRDSGEAQSSKSVQSEIRKIIGEEDKTHPLSDQKIANILKDRGLRIARRTVTKYREGLGILPTTLRKQYQQAT
jgi:RNA polymerase sigma-54 factor